MGVSGIKVHATESQENVEEVCIAFDDNEDAKESDVEENWMVLP